MKKLFLFLALVLVFTLNMGASSPKNKVKKDDIYTQKLLKFYNQQDHKKNERVVVEAAKYTQEAASILHIEKQVDTLLAMWHRESTYNPSATDPKGASLGVCQTQPSDSRRLYRFWKLKGVELGPFSEIRTQVYFGVAVFNAKLQKSNGNVKDAVRRYNGSGNLAKIYAHRVMISRHVIFGRSYTQNEFQKPFPTTLVF